MNREEYYPFGETSFGSYGKKRYRFCGKEKDEESGLYYYGMRYYSAWNCRFMSVDPIASKYPFYTPYQYSGNKPINFIDVDGAEDNNTSTGQNGTNPATTDSTLTTTDSSALGSTPPADSTVTGVKTDSVGIAQSDSITIKPAPKPKTTTVTNKKVNKGVTPKKKEPLSDIGLSEKQYNFFRGDIEEKVPVKYDFKIVKEEIKAVPMDEYFEKTAFPYILEREGGYKDEPEKDKGDPTNKGVSWPTWQAYAMEDLGVEPTLDNLKNLTDEQAKTIYWKRYWNPKGFGNIKDQELALMIYDWTITSGGAIGEIQKLLNSEFDQSLTADGDMGPKTVEAINKVDTDKLFNRIKETRIAYYNKGAEKGWFSLDYHGGLIGRANRFKSR